MVPNGEADMSAMASQQANIGLVANAHDISLYLFYTNRNLVLPMSQLRELLMYYIPMSSCSSDPMRRVVKPFASPKL